MCDKYYGGCECKTLVMGRMCDTCAPAAFGFRSSGCQPCDCHHQVNTFTAVQGIIEDDYNFMHGFPTSSATRIQFWYKEEVEEPDCQWEHPAWCAEGKCYFPYKLGWHLTDAPCRCGPECQKSPKCLPMERAECCACFRERNTCRGTELLYW